MSVVATGWSGHLDFLIDENGKNHFYNVAFDLNKIPENAVWEGVLIKESMWSYPRETSAKENMRKCYNDIVSGKNDIDMSKYSAQLKERFSAENMYSKFADIVLQNAPEGTVVNDMDEIEKLFAEAL